MPDNNNSSNKHCDNKKWWIPWVSSVLAVASLGISIWSIVLSHASIDFDNEVLRFSYDKLGTIIGIIISAVALVVSLFFIILGIEGNSIRREIKNDFEESKKTVDNARANAAEEAKKAVESVRADAAEEAKKAVESVRADAAEESRKAVESVRADAAEESRKAIESIRAEAAEEAREAVENVCNKAAEESRKAIESARANVAEEVKKAFETIRKEFADESSKTVANIRTKVEYISSDIEKKSKENKMQFITMVFELYSEVIGMTQEFYNSIMIGKEEGFDFEHDQLGEPIIKLKLNQCRFVCDPKNLDVEEDEMIKKIIMQGIILIPDLSTDENDLQLLEEVMNKTNDKDIKGTARYAYGELDEKMNSV